MKRLLILILGLALLSGCVVYRVEPYHATTHTVQTTGTTIIHSDIEWAVWEYYDWDYDTVVHLHSLNYTPDEVSLILFLAYHGRVQPATIVQWRRSGIAWIEITTVHLRLEPSIFFVDIPHNTRLGPPYGNVYGYYWKNPRHVVLTDYEMVKLVHLRVVSEAYHVHPVEVIRIYEKDNDYDRIVQREHREGKEIRTKKGRSIREIPPRVNKPDNQRREQPNKPNNPPDRPDRDKPDNDKPKAKPEHPDKDKPDKDKTKDDKPKDSPKESPDKDKPGKDKSDNNNPERNNPDKDKSGKDKPKKGK